jgi:hypothetical protein
VRRLTTLCLTGGLLVAAPAAALAHGELVPWQLPPGETAGLLLLVTHGCADDDEWFSSEPQPDPPTVAVTIQAPLELTIEPAPYEGWTLTTERDASDRLTSATWRSDDPAGTSDALQLPLDVTVADVPDGSEVWLPLIQECAGDEILEQTLEGELRGGDQMPAMRLVANESANAPDPWGEAADGTTPADVADPTAAGAIAASVGLAALGLAGVAFALRRRRHVQRTPAQHG